MRRVRRRFGAFELDLATGELRRFGAVVHLQPQPARVLALLVRRAGEVVSREEIQAEVWGEGTFVDFTRGLNFCVAQVRRALGDDARLPVYVETIPKRGYRFVAPVSEVPAAAVPAMAPPAVPPRRALLRMASLAALLLASALLQGDAGPAAPDAARAEDRLPVTEAARVAHARGLYESRHPELESRAVASLAEAVRLEPGFAPGQVALAQAWLREVEAGRVAAREGMPQARAAAARALALREDAGAHVVLAAVAWRFDWDFAAAGPHLAAALAQDPRSTRAHLEQAALLLATGRPGRALEYAERAEQLDPVCPLVRGDLAGSYYAARRYAEAAAGWARAAAIDPGNVGAHERMVQAYRHAARPQEAAAQALQVLGLVGATDMAADLRTLPAEPAVARFLRGTIRYLSPDARAARLAADRLAVLHAALGEREEALRWLEVAAEERLPTFPLTVATDPDLDPLRRDPRFERVSRLLYGT